MTQEEFNEAVNIAVYATSLGFEESANEIKTAYAALLERNKELSQALLDIAHGPVWWWNDPKYTPEVIGYMMRIAEKALRHDE